MTLDAIVSRAVTMTHLVEAALHSSHLWFIEIGGLRLPAHRTRTADSVSFDVDVPPMCFIEPPTSIALYEGDVLRSVRPLTYPGSAGFQVSWTFDSVPELIPA